MKKAELIDHVKSSNCSHFFVDKDFNWNNSPSKGFEKMSRELILSNENTPEETIVSQIEEKASSENENTVAEESKKAKSNKKK